MGFRFFDIRCRHFNNSLPIHHGSFYLDTDLASVLAQVNDFLSTNRKETIIINIQEEYKAHGNTESFDTTVEKTISHLPPGRVWRKKEIPSLGDVRGKIVILAK